MSDYINEQVKAIVREASKDWGLGWHHLSTRQMRAECALILQRRIQGQVISHPDMFSELQAVAKGLAGYWKD